MRDNQIKFLFSRQFHIGFVRIKQVGYKKNSFFRLFIHKAKNVDLKWEQSRFEKDLRVSRVGPGGSLNPFLFLPIGVISQGLAMVRGRRGKKHT